MRTFSIDPPEANADKTCAYPDCNNTLPKKKRKWCSDECSQLSFWERNWEGLRLIVFIRDNYQCTHCNVALYKRQSNSLYFVKPNVVEGAPILKERANDDWSFALCKLFDKYGTAYPEYYHRSWENGRYEDMPDSIQSLEVDHIEPIFKGGNPLDINNMQALCPKCHKAKTKIDKAALPKMPEMPDENQMSLEEFL